MESRCGETGPDVVILSHDFAGIQQKSCFRVTRSREQPQFFAALDSLGAARGSELVEGAGAVGLDGVFGDKELGGDLPIAQAAGNQGESFELAGGDAKGLLLGDVGSEGFGSWGWYGDEHLLHYDRFPDGLATAGDAETEPDAKGGEENGDERAVELDRVLDDDEAIFGVLEGGNDKAADKTEDENVAIHDGL
jgi:hypothetical protein